MKNRQNQKSFSPTSSKPSKKRSSRSSLTRKGQNQKSFSSTPSKPSKKRSSRSPLTRKGQNQKSFSSTPSKPSKKRNSRSPLTRLHQKKFPSRSVIGIHACLEVLKVRPKKIRSIYLRKDWRKHPQFQWVVEQARRYKIDFFEQTQQQLSSWGQGNQGLALVVEERPRFQLLNQEKSVLVYIDGIEDPRNLGALIRTSWLMGVGGIFLPAQKSLNELTTSVAKIASGGVEHIPVEPLLNPYKWIQEMKNKGYWIYGLHQKGETSIWKEKFNDKIILIIGSEARGIRQKTKNVCDRLVYIPQNHSQANYNLSVAVALGLGQIFHQHSIKC